MPRLRLQLLLILYPYCDEFKLQEYDIGNIGDARH